jgi:heat shock protein HslJ
MKSNVKNYVWSLLAVLLLASAFTACTVSTPTPASPADVDSSQLTSSAWQLVQYQNAQGEAVPVLAETEITAIFGEDGSLVGSAGCNSYTANYKTKGGAIAIGAVAATQMACASPEGVMEQESGYITALSQVLGWNVEGDSLALNDGSGNQLLVYQAVTETAEASLPAETPPALAVEALANATYQSQYTKSGEATLVDGEYREQAAPGSATETVVMLTEHMAVVELEDGQPAAAVILVTDPGGSGTFYDLHVLIASDGEPTDIATAFLGDRVQIDSLSVNEDGVIAVDMITHGPDDPLCCPTLHVLQTYVVQRGELVEGSRTELGTVQ